MTLGDKIAKERKDQHYTQEQLADLLGVSRQSVSKWESGLAYPETEKLIQLGKLFDCSMDYLLKEDITQKNGTPTLPSPWDKLGIAIQKQLRERKSEKTLFGLPLYHIARNARGFFAIGLHAKGIISIGLLARGILSLGLLSTGGISVGLLSLGIIAFGTLAFGGLSIGSIAIGLFAIGAVAIGILSLGALSLGCFAMGASAMGHYAAIGDVASGMVTLGHSMAKGSVYAEEGPLRSADFTAFLQALDSVVPVWFGWAKEIFIQIWNMIKV